MATLAPQPLLQVWRYGGQRWHPRAAGQLRVHAVAAGGWGMRVQGLHTVPAGPVPRTHAAPFGPPRATCRPLGKSLLLALMLKARKNTAVLP